MISPSSQTTTPTLGQRLSKWIPGVNAIRNFVRERVARTEPTPFWVLVDLDEELNAAGIHLILAELKDPVRDKIERYGLYETIDRRHFYPTIEVAIQEFHREWQERKNQAESNNALSD
jgi:hypothetical protein